jgi:uncharacterized protein YciI
VKPFLFRCACLVCLQISGQAFAEDTNYFLLKYLPGSSWNRSISYEEQPGLKKHHEYLKGLHINDILVMGGTVDDGDAGELSVMLLRTSSLEEAEKIASQDPGVQMRLVRAEVTAWNLNMSSMRFVQRRPYKRIEDPGQSFSIKRIDPESRLNISD